MTLLRKYIPDVKHEYVSWAWELRKAVEMLTNGSIQAHETLTAEQKASIINNPALFGSNVMEFHAAFEHTFPEWNKDGGKNIYEVIRALGFRVNDENHIQIPPNYTIGILLQKLGTDVARHFIDNDIWVRRTLAARAEMAKDQTMRIMDWYPDTRFVNEFETIQRACGFLIKITRPELKNNNKTSERNHDDKRDANHESETALNHITDDKWHVLVRNDGSLDDLDREAQRVSVLIRRHFNIF